jgi:hypothetical protein
VAPAINRYVHYGYNYLELELPKINAWKEEVKVLRNKLFQTTRRPAISVDLGCPLLGAVMPHVNPNDPKTVLAGALKRFATQVKPPKTQLWSDLLKFTADLVQKEFKPLNSDADISVDTWLKNCKNYSDARKVELKTKHEEMWRLPRSKILKVKSFVKDEYYPLLKHSRSINSRSDEYKTLVGPIFALIEKELFKHPDFVKHIPVPDRPQALLSKLFRVGAKYCGTDFTSMEAHFDELRFGLEFIFYKFMISALPNGKQWFNLVRKIAGKNVCIFKFFVLSLKGSRMSGEMNTSLGNGFVNWVLSKFCAFLEKDLGHAGFFEGDDGVIVGNSLPTKELYADLGFDVKTDPQVNLTEMSFCGLVFDQEDLVNITDPMEELCTFGWSKYRYTGSRPAVLKALLRAKSISMLYQYNGCPILQSLAKYGLRVTNRICTDRIQKYMSDWEKTQFSHAMEQYKRDKFMSLINRPVGMRTRLLMEKVHKIRIEDQLYIEKYLDDLNVLQPLDIPETMIYIPEHWKLMWHQYVLPIEPSKIPPELLLDSPLRIAKLGHLQEEWDENLFS